LSKPDITWQAVYADHTANQYNPDGVQNSYDLLDRKGLTSFNLVNSKGETIVKVPLTVGAKLFYRMRIAFQQKSGSREMVYILGWQSPTDRHIWLVHQDGKVESFRNFAENSRWLYAPNFREYEKVRSIKPQIM
jgi:hypothetical protein